MVTPAGAFEISKISDLGKVGTLGNVAGNRAAPLGDVPTAYGVKLTAPVYTRRGLIEAGATLMADPDASLADGDLVVLRRADGGHDVREINGDLRLDALIGVESVDWVCGVFRSYE